MHPASPGVAFRCCVTWPEKVFLPAFQELLYPLQRESSWDLRSDGRYFISLPMPRVPMKLHIFVQILVPFICMPWELSSFLAPGIAKVVLV